MERRTSRKPGEAVTTLPFSLFFGIIHGARTLETPRGRKAKRRKEGGRQKRRHLRPAAAAKQPVPPRSVFLPWRRPLRVAPTDILLPTRGLHVPPLPTSPASRAERGNADPLAPIRLLIKRDSGHVRFFESLSTCATRASTALKFGTEGLFARSSSGSLVGRRIAVGVDFG